MSKDDLIFLPVSLGEAIDKLTILDIKLERISDHRVKDVKKEYDLLYEKLKDFLIKYNDLYQSMKKVNTLIWDMMDVLRDGKASNEEYLKVCKECIEYNDIRFRVKNKINYLSNSSLKEQKGYEKNVLLIELSNEITNINDFIRPIKYYSFLYDEIIISYLVSSDKTLTSLKNDFSYDPTIIFIHNEGNAYAKRENENATIKKTYWVEGNLGKDDVYKIFEVNETMLDLIL